MDSVCNYFSPNEYTDIGNLVHDCTMRTTCVCLLWTGFQYRESPFQKVYCII